MITLPVPLRLRGDVAITPLLLVVVALPTPSNAAPGTVDLSWGACSPVVAAIANPAQEPVSLFASVVGNDEHHVAYQVRFKMAGLGGTTPPDAWRFDPGGCQTGTYLAIRHVPVGPSPECPPFQASGPSTQIKSFNFFPPGLGYPTNLLRGTLANTYPGGTQALAGQRYFLAEFVFDHTFSVPGNTIPGLYCGGFTQPVVIALLTDPLPGVNTSSYIRTQDGVEVGFLGGNTVVTVNGAVPAEGPTWGQIKSIYRR